MIAPSLVCRIRAELPLWRIVPESFHPFVLKLLEDCFEQVELIGKHERIGCRSLRI